MLSTATTEANDHGEPIVAAIKSKRNLAFRRLASPKVAAWIILAVALGVWQYIGTYATSIDKLTSDPVLVAERFGTMVSNGQLVHNAVPTIEETVGGLAIGLVIGTLAGVVMALSRYAGTIGDPYVVGINGVPRIALGPFFVIWFGIGLLSKVLFAASIVFVVILFNAREGVQSIDRDLLDAMKSMRASRWQVVRYVGMPSLAPWLFASLKVGIGIALTGAVVGEFVGSSAGLGWYIQNSLNLLDITGAMTALLAMAVLAMLMYYAVRMVEARVLRWRTLPGSGR